MKAAQSAYRILGRLSTFKAPTHTQRKTKTRWIISLGTTCSDCIKLYHITTDENARRTRYSTTNVRTIRSLSGTYAQKRTTKTAIEKFPVKSDGLFVPPRINNTGWLENERMKRESSEREEQGKKKVEEGAEWMHGEKRERERKQQITNKEP